MTNYNDGEWHGWNGDFDMPTSIHAMSRIEYVWHDEYNGEIGQYYLKAGEVGWSQTIKFRVIKEHKEPPKPREFWIDLIDMVATQEPCHANSYFIKVREVLE